MKTGPVVVWSVLLAAGLFSAYLTWTRGSGIGSEQTVTLLNLEPDEVTALRLETGSRIVEVALLQGEWWVTVTDRASGEKAAPARDATGSQGATLEAPLAPGSASARRSPDPVQREFRANERAAELAARFTPLVGSRDLGTLARERLSEFGLASPGKTLTVTHHGGEESFDIGGHPYGSSQLYLRRRRDGRVYLGRARSISELEDSEAWLLDRRLHRFPLVDVDRIVVSSAERQIELVRRTDAGSSPGSGSDTSWVAANAPEEPSDLYGNWVRKAYHLYAGEFLEPAMPGARTPVVTIEYYRGAEKQGQLELYSETVEGEGTSLYCARSEHTFRWVRVAGSEVAAVARDVENILAP